eukprot:TRINITY_DN2898_c0_g1_i1.p1 TRINITY_DN2898_c0_g1~~TRINITY_DN2898_c0_g1_i1.p1  ORF type:complete len:218 (-),score=49.41 TRINITY_DN2898_c0_g1_i1:73-726(-)
MSDQSANKTPTAGEGAPRDEAVPTKRTIVNKLVMLGDVYVGKTSISTRFAKGEFFEHQESTVGAVFLTHAIDTPEATVKFDIWDTAGQERYRSLAPMYYKGAKAAVVVYDISNYDTFRRAQQWVEELHENANPQIAIAFVGNKLDLEDGRQVSTQDAKDYADRKGLLHFEVSAKKGTNVSDVFLTLARKIPTTSTTTSNDQKLEARDRVEKQGSCCS